MYIDSGVEIWGALFLLDLALISSLFILANRAMGVIAWMNTHDFDSTFLLVLCTVSISFPPLLTRHYCLLVGGALIYGRLACRYDSHSSAVVYSFMSARYPHARPIAATPRWSCQGMYQRSGPSHHAVGKRTIAVALACLDGRCISAVPVTHSSQLKKEHVCGQTLEFTCG